MIALNEKNTDMLIGTVTSVNTDVKPISTGTKNMALESQVERIEKLKKLLDSGVITEEEFDQKKKQILGL